MEWFFWVLCLGLLVAVAANIFNFVGGDRNGWRLAGTAAGIVAALTIGTAGYFANSKIKEAAAQALEAADKADRFAKSVNALHWGGHL
jgi:anti-sigma-K factor RskA